MSCSKSNLTNETPIVSSQYNDSIKLKSKENGKRTDYIDWEDYFMATAILASKRSKDPNTQVGACIVDNENRIVAIGYNGFPRGCHDDVFSWRKPTDIASSESKEDDMLEDKNLYVVHAEANAILNKNTANINGTKLYTTLFPCNECAKLIIQSGIREIYYLSDEKAMGKKARASKRMFNVTNIKYKRFRPKYKQIVIDLDY